MNDMLYTMGSIKDTIEFETKNTIDMLKYALINDNKMEKLQDNIKSIQIFIDKTNEKDAGSIQIPEIDDIDINNSHSLFKKINISFKCLSKIMRILILRVDDKRYIETQNQKIIFPHDLDTLIVVLGTFGDAFNAETTEMLLNIVGFRSYTDLYSISDINSFMIPFVVDDTIKEDMLKKDFDEFAVLVSDFACEVLNINTEFNPHDMIEVI